ncbi:MAG: SDR family oxidoreductase [Pseudomonadota bacterium]
MLNNQIEGSRVVITGGSSGIGLEVAHMALAAGAQHVTLLARNVEKLDSAAQLLSGSVAALALDVTDETAVAAAFDQIGAFDHLVTAAAGTVRGTIVEVDTQAARGLFEAKFWGQHHCIKYGAPNMSQRGSITLFSGWISRKPMKGLGTLAAVDGAIESLGRVAALELAPIRVNTIVPGQIDTPLWRTRLSEEAAQAYFGTVDNDLPVGRRGQPEEVAQAILALMNNPFITGTTLDIDGGQPTGRHD